MATYLNPNISKEGILSVGDNIIYTCPYKYYATFNGFRFTSPSAYTISIRIERADPPATITYYNFTLDPGDVMTDAGGYTLFYGDQLIINTNAADVTYILGGQVLPIILGTQP